MKIPHISLFGIAISRMNMHETVQYITESIHRQDHEVRQIVTVNPIMVMKGLEDARFMTVLKEAELVVPDGTGIVWAAKTKGTPVAERVAGYDLLHELLQAGQHHRWRVYLLGASPEVIAEAVRRLNVQYPQLDIVGYHDGYFTSDQDQRIIEEIRQAAPQLLFVANDLDRQDPWIHQYKAQLRVPVMMGVGGSFDVIAGKIKRAPVLFQKLRLEWFYRLIKQPTRFVRMLALPRFVIAVMRSEKRR